MKIAIHHRGNSFSSDWIKYCENNSIPYKLVSCYDTDIVDQVKDCNALMWHFHQANSKDVLFAKQLIYSLQTAGKIVFPNFKTAWHFDDKIGQTYLLESVNAPVVPSYIFYDKEQAMEWLRKTEFPKVFKLRRGSGSSQVHLVKNYKEGKKYIGKAFGRGFNQYDAGPNLKERWRKYREGLSGLTSVIKGIIRLGYTTDFDRVTGNEKGYAYFQDFIQNNDSDIRVIVIAGKAFAIKRMVRKDDFRASGSGHIKYGKEHFDEDTVQLSFEIARNLNTQTLALDYVYDNGKPKIVEISYGYTKEVYEDCQGYWDSEMQWHEGPFNPQNWMIEAVLNKLKTNLVSSGSV